MSMMYKINKKDLNLKSVIFIMVNYNHNVIYKIQHKNNENLLYIGSSTDFNKRKKSHQYCCNHTEYNNTLYTIINNNGGWDMFICEIIEIYPCKNRIEAVIKEQEYITKLNPSINTQRAYVSNETKCNERKEYYSNHKEQYRQYDRERYKKDPLRAKRYLENNPEKKKQYYLNNKRIVTCECGCSTSYNHLSRHKKSKKHLKYVEENTKTE